MAGAENLDFVGAPAFRPVKLRPKKPGFSPGAVRQFPHGYWRSLEKSAGLKPEIESGLYRRTKVRRSHKTKFTCRKNTFSASCKAPPKITGPNVEAEASTYLRSNPKSNSFETHLNRHKILRPKIDPSI